MALSPYVKSLSVVLVGGFNPNNYNLDRLNFFELFNKKDSDDAVVVQGSNFLEITLPWVRMYVSHERLMLSTKSDEYFYLFKDLLISLSSLFATTSVTGMGINSHLWYKLKNKDEWHKLGHALVPKDIWKESLELEDNYIGTRNLRVIIEDFTKTPVNGSLSVELKPVLDDDEHYADNSVFIGYNCHFNTKNSKPELITEIISENLEFLKDKYLDLSLRLIEGAIVK